MNLPGSYHLTSAAARRLTEKYGDDTQRELEITMNDGDALHAVSTAVQAELGGKDYRSAAPADRDDCLAALCLADSARRQVDHDELVAIEGARAKGSSWEAIGVALGHTSATAAAAARIRHVDLLRRFPGYRSIEVPALP
jgi:ActR/RegA family two-component response regulator